MPSLLSRVTSSAQVLPARTFFYAREKWGKSSLFAHAPGVIYFMTRGETGLVELIAGGRVPPTPHFDYDEAAPPTWETLRDAVRELIAEDHPYKMLAIDTANGAEILCQEYVRNSMFKGSHNAFASYGKGWDACRVQWLGLLQDLDDLRTRRKMAITFLAHTKVKKFDDPTQDESYDKYTPACQEKLWDLTHKWSDIICFGHFETTVYETASGKNRASKDVKRVVCFNQSPTWEAGNRYGITGELDVSGGAEAGYRLFDATVAKARAAGLPPVTAEQFKVLLDKKGKTWAQALAAIDAKQKTTHVANKTPFAQVDPAHVASFSRWLEKQPDAAAPPTSPPAPAAPPVPPVAPPPPAVGADDADPTDEEYDAASSSGPDVHPEDDGVNEPPLPQTMPAAERRTDPPARISGDFVKRIIDLLGDATGLDWAGVRDGKGIAAGWPTAFGFPQTPNLKIGQLSPDSGMKLLTAMLKVKEEKDKRKRAPKPKVEQEGNAA